ncbi:MAG TPA: DUF2073 domain-containing protein [Candidatus Paceibacterota bacterium]|nr:DUF2073 domain-containing protein [Candidatus Paceibacterota bacterium]
MKKNKKINGLTIEFMSYSEIRNLESAERIKKILAVVLGNKIVILQGRLKPDEETRLIEDTMAMIGHVKGFKGIELAVIGSENKLSISKTIASNFAKILVGDTAAMTLIGPANIIKDIKRNPKKIELMLRR